MKISRPTRQLFHTGVSLQLPSRLEADSLAKLYCENFESVYRILHIPSFWTEYDRFWTNPDSAPISLRLQVLLVTAIGASLHTFTSEERRLEFGNMVQQWIFTAQTWLAGPLEKDQLRLFTIQLHCLTIIARQIFCIGADLIWTSMGSLLHVAMHIGLHRDPKNLPPVNPLQAEMRRRLWATILEMLAQSSLDSEMQPRISTDAFDTEPPSNNNDDEINELRGLSPHPESEHTTISAQRILLRSLPTRLRSLELMNGSATESSRIMGGTGKRQINDTFPPRFS